MTLILRLTAWALLAGLTILTIGPVVVRPDLPNAPPSIEHALAFGAFGACLALAYPRRWLVPVLVVASAAVALESLQILAPGRHARVVDAVAKLIGGEVGVGLGLATTAIIAVLTHRTRS